jgi:CrcB protein
MASRTPADVLAVVAAGGALGAAARYGLAAAWPTPAAGFPWATLLVNLAGCAVLGAVMELLADLSAPHRLARPFLGTGLLGGFTTFSTYAVEARDLLAAGRFGLAAAYVVGTLVGALAAVWGSMMVVRLTAGRRG